MSTQDRQVKGYLKPKYKNLVTAYTGVKEMTTSEVVNLAIENFFNNMPEGERQRLLAVQVQAPLQKNYSKNSY